MRMEAKKESKDLSECRNKSFKFLKKMKRKKEKEKMSKAENAFKISWRIGC